MLPTTTHSVHHHPIRPPLRTRITMRSTTLSSLRLLSVARTSLLTSSSTRVVQVSRTFVTSGATGATLRVQASVPARRPTLARTSSMPLSGSSREVSPTVPPTPQLSAMTLRAVSPMRTSRRRRLVSGSRTTSSTWSSSRTRLCKHLYSFGGFGWTYILLAVGVRSEKRVGLP